MCPRWPLLGSQRRNPWRMPSWETGMSVGLHYPVGNTQPCLPREASISWTRWPPWLLPQSTMWTTREGPTLSCATRAASSPSSIMTPPSWRVTTQPWPSSSRSKTASATFSRISTGLCAKALVIGLVKCLSFPWLLQVLSFLLVGKRS